jgi:hypothetical protein
VSGTRQNLKDSENKQKILHYGSIFGAPTVSWTGCPLQWSFVEPSSPHTLHAVRAGVILGSSRHPCRTKFFYFRAAASVAFLDHVLKNGPPQTLYRDERSDRVQEMQ